MSKTTDQILADVLTVGMHCHEQIGEANDAIKTLRERLVSPAPLGADVLGQIEAAVRTLEEAEFSVMAVGGLVAKARKQMQEEG